MGFIISVIIAIIVGFALIDKHPTAARVLFTVLIPIAAAVGLFFLTMIVGMAFGGWQALAVVVSGIALTILLIMLLWGTFKDKKFRRVVIIAVLAFVVLSNGGAIGYRYALLYDDGTPELRTGESVSYHLSGEQVEVQSESLHLFQPFAKDTLAASLDEPSTLRILDNRPKFAAKLEDLPRIDGATSLYPLYAAFVRATYPEGKYYWGDYDPYKVEHF